MRNSRQYLCLLAAAGMDFFWITASVAFLFSLGHWPGLPPLEVTGTFWMAVFITRITVNKGWRIVTVLAIQLVGLTAAALRLIYVYGRWQTPFFGREWLVNLSTGVRSPTEWFILIITALSGAVLWWGGFAAARRQLSYNKLCSRFDLGIGIFFFLLLIGAGIGVNDQLMMLFAIPFFFAGMLGIALGRNRDLGQKSFLLGYRGLGLILACIGLVILSGAAVISFLLPFLTYTAKTGYLAMRAAAGPAVPYLIKIIKFWFGFGLQTKPEENSGPLGGSQGQPHYLPGEHWLGSLPLKLLGWGLVILLGAAAILLTGWGLWRLFLLLRRPMAVTNTEQRGSLRDFLAWLNCIRIRAGFFLNLIGRYLLRSGQGPGSEIQQQYRQLEKWGRARGLPALPWETPTEYGVRLGRKFPKLAAEIKLVVDSFNREVYGG